MKLVIVAAFLAVMLAAGCGDDSNPLTPGDPSDPDLATYLNQYEGIAQFTEFLLVLPIEVVDLISSTGPAPGLHPEQEDFTLDYNETTKFWVFTTTFCDDSDPDSATCFAIRDSLQLRQGSVASQYPDSLTSVRSFLTVLVSGSEVESGDGYQNLTYTVVTEDPTVLRVDGTGGIDAALAVSDEDTTGFTICDTLLDLRVTVNAVLIAFESPECPVGGTLTHSGPTVIQCTGADPGSVSGSWSATETYDPQGFVVIGEGKRWELELECNGLGFTLAPKPPSGSLARAWRSTGR